MNKPTFSFTDWLDQNHDSLAYEELGFLSSAPPERSIRLYCDRCHVQWTGCQDAAECPRCDNTDAWEANLSFVESAAQWFDEQEAARGLETEPYNWQEVEQRRKEEVEI